MPKSKDGVKDLMSADLFVDLLAFRDWHQIPDMVKALDEGKFWDDNRIAAEAVAKYKKDFTRRLARTLRKDNGDPVFVNVVRTLKGGKKVNIYKQLGLFDTQDVRYVVQFHKQLGFHHMAEANWFARWGRRNLSMQLPLPFPEMDGDGGK